MFSQRIVIHETLFSITSKWWKSKRFNAVRAQTEMNYFENQQRSNWIFRSIFPLKQVTSAKMEAGMRFESDGVQDENFVLSRNPNI